MHNELPKVAAVLLVHDGRYEMARAAIRAFEAQTYVNKVLVIVDSTKERSCTFGGWHSVVRALPGYKLGALRNTGNLRARDVGAKIVVHWDSDDYSESWRIANQVTLLRSGHFAVGYREALFWREEEQEAWRYYTPNHRYALTGTLCYWMSVWNQMPFPNLQRDECSAWLQRPGMCFGSKSINDESLQPAFVARIHKGNTSIAYRRDLMEAIEKQGGEWKRVPEYDQYCAGVMAL